MDSEELRKDVIVDIRYNYINKSYFLIVDFPLGPNHDLHQFLLTLGTVFQKHYVKVNQKYVLYVRHELPKDEAERILEIHMHEESLDDYTSQENIQSCLLERVQENYVDDIDSILETAKKDYRNDFSILLEEIVKLELEYNL